MPRRPFVLCPSRLAVDRAAGIWSNTRNFIDGPNAASFDDLPSPSGDNGYRIQGGVQAGNLIFEVVYSHFGDMLSTFNENVNGVAFNAAAKAGNWAKENSINGNTYFTPIVNAASLTSGTANTASDQSGLGPSTAFTTDGKPALMAVSRTDFYMTEINLKDADCLLPLAGRGLRWEWATSMPTSTTRPGLPCRAPSAPATAPAA